MEPDERLRCLMRSKSPYILEAMKSPVKWWGWCQEALERARVEDKPILIDVGAGWCHWCHVMDEETYGDPEVADLINNYFIPIKIDRDERPDLDRRFQEIAMLISGQGGWPLTIILTPNGEPMYAATYLPPRDKMGIPGMIRVLRAALDAYRNNREQISELSRQIREALRPEAPREGELDPGIVDDVVTSIAELYDEDNGGFGTMPKFPQPTFHALLLYRGYYVGNVLIKMVTHTLKKMARGGIYDQLCGGFHRYSVDREWLIPHFEKLLIDNAELLINYAETHAATGDEELRETAQGIINYINNTLTNPEGGFYASQDADVDPNDEGGYYKWSVGELKNLLTRDEYEVIYWYYGVYRFGNNEKAVLNRAMELTDVAAKLGMTLGEARKLLESARTKLINARKARKTPRVDTTIYTGWSAAAAIAYMRAADYLGTNTMDQALKTLEFIMNKLYINGELHRYHTSETPGLLEDYAYTALLAMEAYSHTGLRRYLEFAIKLSNDIINKFQAEDGGFYDTQTNDVMNIKIKPITDTPNWSPNSLALMALMNVGRAVGNNRFMETVERGIKALYQAATGYGAGAASYFIALDQSLREPPKIIVIGDPGDVEFKQLLNTALTTFRPGKLVIPITEEVTDLITDETTKTIISQYRKDHKPKAHICAYTACTTPITNPDKLREATQQFMKEKYK
ncbi:thioredoxin domain-containing protein [Vulcanisaeta thermophila]|uniref:thioredoxin domain-containing protein n=1 Tax=Vulcanisaeta thermophila TaxID=867917 RepID=UPI000852E340|nr:thioredoxin domain-containing protein [Vulcanisaeta thermophila]